MWQQSLMGNLPLSPNTIRESTYSMNDRNIHYLVFCVPKLYHSLVNFVEDMPRIGENCSTDTTRVSHRVTHSPTFGKNNAHLVIFVWKMSILKDLTDRYGLESISSRI